LSARVKKIGGFATKNTENTKKKEKERKARKKEKQEKGNMRVEVIL